MQSVQITDPTSGSTASIASSFGFNCFEFHAAVPGGSVVNVIHADPDFAQTGEKPSHNGIPLLFPFPNRIRDGRFTWGKRDYNLPPDRVANDGAGNAIHGFCLDRPWRVVERQQDSATGEFRLSHDANDRLDLWPADFVIRVRYTVSGSTLACDIEVSNPDTKQLPWGFGTHAYFRLPLASSSQSSRCLIQAPATEQWELVDCLPTGKKCSVPEQADLREGAYFDVLKLDDVLGGLESSGQMIDTTIYDETAGLQLTQRFDTSFRELVAFTPPWTQAVCLEPYTCVTDAINLQQQGIDAGLRILEPGQTWIGRIEITADRIMA